jgi:UDP-N-acetylglucosamine acyltransferase
LSASRIHPTAVIDPKAELDPTVEIGPYAVIEAGVRIGPGTIVGPHVHIQGQTTIGRENEIGSHAMIGHAPQHMAYRGEPRRLRIGDRNRIREFVTIHRAFEEGEGTIVGDDCMFMGASHVGHDCHVGNSVILVNYVALGGHAIIGDRAFISGYTGVHQFCRIGRLAFLGGLIKVTQDVPPFLMVDGNPPRIRALNSVGIRRAGISAESQKELRRVFKHLYLTIQPIRTAIASLDLESLGPEARELVAFYSASKRGVISGPGGRKSKAPDEEPSEA